MKTILLIHGPNLNKLGKRDQKHYGSLILADIEKLVTVKAAQANVQVRCYQSNHEGGLIDWIQKNSDQADGVIVNAGALTHYSYALHDALLDTALPCIEVHLSNIVDREDWRKISVIKPACLQTISGKKEAGYTEAVEILLKKI